MKQRLILNLGQVHDLLPLTAIQMKLQQYKQRDTTAERVNSGRMSWHCCQGKLCSSSTSDIPREQQTPVHTNKCQVPTLDGPTGLYASNYNQAGMETISRDLQKSIQYLYFTPERTNFSATHIPQPPKDEQPLTLLLF